MDGSAYSYQRWALGQPNDANGNDDCVYVATGGSYPTEWNDSPCDGDLFAYLCQMDKGKTVVKPWRGLTFVVLYTR